MTVKRLNCPGCSTSVNVPAAMANVKCPSCGTIWNVENPGAAQISPQAKAARQTAQADAKSSTDKKSNNAVIAALVGGALALLAIVGIGVTIISQTPAPSEVAAEGEREETIKPREPQEFRVVSLPEDQRRRIYDDYRKVARTTLETPLAIPQGGKIRASVEGMLEKTYDREIRRFAALHDVTVEDIEEIIKEGDAKTWDNSVRSNAVRNGQRVYDKEMSQPKP